MRIVFAAVVAVAVFLGLGHLTPQRLQQMQEVRQNVTERIEQFVAEGKVAPPKFLEQEIDIEGPIDSQLAYSVDQALETAKKLQVTHLHIVINSPGGSVFDGLSVIDHITKSGIPTTCEVGDFAASMAAILLESSACGERVVNAHSIVMFHGVAVDMMGRVRQQDAEALAQALRAVNLAVANFVAPRLRMSVADYLALIEGEVWLVGDENLGFHSADRVLPVRAPSR